MIIFTEKELIFGQMDANTKVNGPSMSIMAMEFTVVLLVTLIKVRVCLRFGFVR